MGTPPARRAADGYRVYDSGVVERLAIIARAEQLGCTLEEIAEIFAAGEAGHCVPVQNRLSEVLAGRMADAGGRIVELAALVADLQRIATVMGSFAPRGSVR